MGKNQYQWQRRDFSGVLFGGCDSGEAADNSSNLLLRSNLGVMAKLGRKMYSHSTAAAKYSICAERTQKKTNCPTEIFSNFYSHEDDFCNFVAAISFQICVCHPLQQSHAIFPLPLLRIWQIKAFTDPAPRGKKSHLDIFSKRRQIYLLFRQIYLPF